MFNINWVNIYKKDGFAHLEKGLFIKYNEGKYKIFEED